MIDKQKAWEILKRELRGDTLIATCHCDAIEEVEPDVWLTRKSIVFGQKQEPMIDDDKAGIRYTIARNGIMRESRYRPVRP